MSYSRLRLICILVSGKMAWVDWFCVSPRPASDMSDSREILNASLRDTTFNNTVPSPPRYMVINVTLFLVVIFLIGVIGNSLVIVVVVHSRNMRTSVNYFLVNLCIADLLLLILCMPTALVDIYAQDRWYFGKLMCKYIFCDDLLLNKRTLYIWMYMLSQSVLC